MSENVNVDVPKIIYSSRTHSQLSKVISELSSSAFKPKMVVMGSRHQLCIHPTVQSANQSSKNGICRSLVNAGRCKHFDAVPNYVASNPHVHDVVDIEDMVKIGKQENVCPYYMARERVGTSEIAFMPYNYLIDSTVRRSLKSLAGSILIFDEAHNLDSVCADASSFELNEQDLHDCIKSLTKWQHTNPAETKDCDIIVQKIPELILQFKRIQNGDHAGSVIVDAFENAGITLSMAESFAESLEQHSGNMATAKIPADGVQSLITVLRVVFGAPRILNETPLAISKFYRTHVAPRDGYSDQKVFSYWCFHPGIALRVLRAQHDIRCVIFASGTLSPMESCASEFGSGFPIRLENPHVIQSSQLWAGIVKVGPSGESMDFSFQNRKSKAYLEDLGRNLVNFARLVPDGMLVFFPSYSALEDCCSEWKRGGEKGVWSSLLKHKRIVEEPRSSNHCQQAIKDFQTKLEDGSKKGVAFFAVCRGKVAEGLDFADKNGRAVIIVGIPFPSVTDPKVVAKKKFLNHERKENPLLMKGEDWYQHQATSAVNQAVGRVIRHRFDFGAMIFLDCRYEKMACDPLKPFVSSWIRPYVRTFSDYGKATVSLGRFFQNAPKVVKELKEKAMLERKVALENTLTVNKNRSALSTTENAEGRSNVHKVTMSTANKAGNEKMQRVSRAQSFLDTCKKTLDAESFAHFTTCLRKYRTQEITVQKVMNECIPLFISVSDTHVRNELLLEFEAFLPSKIKDDFQKSVQRLTSLLPSAASKRISLHGSTEPRLAALKQETGLEALIQRRAVSEEKKQTNVEMIELSPEDEEELSKRREKREREEADQREAEERERLEQEDAKRRKEESKKKEEEQEEENVAAPKCTICHESFKSPFSSNCGHVCCYACWQQWLTQKLECPICKEKVRMKQLRKIYFI